VTILSDAAFKSDRRFGHRSLALDARPARGRDARCQFVKRAAPGHRSLLGGRAFPDAVRRQRRKCRFVFRVFSLGGVLPLFAAVEEAMRK
jgi:hypothetical protein